MTLSISSGAATPDPLDPMLQNSIMMADCILRALTGLPRHNPVPQADGYADACPGCTGASDDHIAACALSPDAVAKALDKKEPAGLKPFDLDAAMRGAAFIHRFDIGRPRWEQRILRKVRFFDDPDHPAYLVWSEEWLVYPADDEGIEEMSRDFRMVEVVNG